MDIGKKLKELRQQKELTLEDLASRSELTKGFLSQVERNLDGSQYRYPGGYPGSIGNESVRVFP